jgi:hypothetical protein
VPIITDNVEMMIRRNSGLRSNNAIMTVNLHNNDRKITFSYIVNPSSNNVWFYFGLYLESNLI